MISQDVFHSFSIPDFRVKREVIPGRYSTVWFKATTPGTYHIFCTQYCGTNHSAMIGEVTVLSPDDYEKWTQESTSGMSLAQNGERLFASMGCNACHSGSAAARGPNLAGVYGSKLQLTNGSQVLVNDAYLRDAILNPSQHITAGYAPIMPTYQGQISEDGLIDLVEYIKTIAKQLSCSADADHVRVEPSGADNARGGKAMSATSLQSSICLIRGRRPCRSGTISIPRTGCSAGCSPATTSASRCCI